MLDIYSLLVYNTFSMRNTSRRDAYAHRPIKTGADAVSEARFEPDSEFLMETDDFIDVIEKAYGFEVTRRTLQLYSSPQHKLLSPPIYIGGHRSYYLNPEHTQRLAAVLYLSTRLFMPLKAIRKLLRVFPERHYRVLLKGVLTPQELTDFTELFGQGLDVRDFLFYKVSRVLSALDEDHGEEREQDEATKDKALFSMARQFEKWMNSGRHHSVEAALKYETDA
jgi:hypothetical protein